MNRPLSRGELRQIARMHLAIVCFYAVDAAFLLGFAAQQVVSTRIGWRYGATGMALAAAQISIFRRGRRSLSSLATHNIGMTLGACALMLLTALDAPRIGGFMLMTLMTVLAMTALQLDQRHLSIVYLTCIAGAGTALLVADAPLEWPMRTAAQKALSAAWFALLLGKCAAINIFGTQLRRHVRDVNLRLAAALAEVEKVASTDELTLLPNRRAIATRLRDAVEAAPCQSGFVGVALFDIDRFKDVNDRFGHAVGDEVLKVFGTLVASSLRPDDRVGRYGGEEFLLVLRRLASLDSAREAAERMRRAIETYDWSRVASGLVVTASAGVALIGTDEPGPAALGRADAALYRAKAAGRNRIVLAEAGTG